ncbi:DUF1467 family protein, partial [Pseudomonas sp. BJa3]|uniref:DUF1467 family protein n=1 Tax=Pseudomonas sp. BJa3 TaxID=2986525 RepID=UPI003A7F5910
MKTLFRAGLLACALFAVLPLGTASETHEPPTDGSQWGAPKTPNLKKKFLTTTWVSAL